MYGGYTEEDTYCNTLVDTASVGEEDSGESDIDDLETRLYSQIHYGEPMLNDGEILSEPATDLSRQENQKHTEKTGSQLLSELCSASLPSTSCQVKNENQSNESDSGTNTDEKIPESDKSQDTILKADSNALSTDDSTVKNRDLSVIDRHGSTTNIMLKDRINGKRRKIEYILVDTESDGAKPEKMKLKDVLHKNTNTKTQMYDVDTLDSDSDTSVVEITSDEKVEYVSLITDDERYQEDISVHASFGSDSVMEGQSAGRQSGDTTMLGDTGIDVEQSTLEEVLESLGECDWSSKPEQRPVFIKQRGRYYQSKKCEKCDGKGHQSRDCPKKIMVCLQCGEKGHMCKSCPRPVCFNCFNLGHTRNDCREPRRVRWKKCSRCQMQGHKEMECPNRWRQFHLTTKLEEPVHGENTENDYVYCSNCGKEGHFYHDCVEDTMFGNQWETWPFIVGYTLEREMDSLLNWRDECITDQPSVRKGKSKKKPKKPHRLETTVNMLDNRPVKNKGKKRKWKEHDEPTEQMPATSRAKKPKLEPHIKKKGKRKHQAEQNEGVDYMERGSYHDVGNDTVPRVVVQAYNSNRSHAEQKKKRKKKKKSTYKQEGDKGVDVRHTKKKRTPNKQYQQTSNNSNSTRGFRYGQGAEVSHTSHSARHWGNERSGKSRKKCDKKRGKGGGGGYGHRQNGYWEGENIRQGRKRQF